MDQMSDIQRPAYFFTQSAVIPFRGRGKNLEVMLITSRGGRKWLVPKGVVEPGMTPQDSAAKEAMEEAGIHGRVLPLSFGCFTYAKWGGVCRVEVFPLRVESVRDEWSEPYRKRVWMPYTTAERRVCFPELGQMIGKLPRLLRDLEG
ncbi:MAG: NUDIX hydrolase [Magnetococcus sp. WYHC-3]